ncbi:MAG: hypothetical protein ABIE23_04025 [archaeon]
MKRVGIFLGLVLLLFFSGCLDQKTFFENKMKCLDLTSYSFTSIPKCSSQEECFEKVRKNFFSFDKNLFSNSVQQKMHLYQNQVARSWLYYNKALEKVKQANQACYSDNYSVLPSLVNELNHLLLKSFGEMDKASITSFSVLLTEKNDLEKDEINLIKEENLFDDYVKINANLNDLLISPYESPSTSSYVSLYFSRMNEVQSSLSSIGFKKDYSAEFSLLDLVDYYDQDLVEQVEDKKFYIPLLKNTFLSFISLVSKQNDLASAVSILLSMDSFSLFSALNALAGTNNSVVEEFSFILRDDFLHRNELEQRAGKLEKESTELISLSQKKINQLSSSPYASFDSNFLADLYSLLEQTPSSTITTQKFSFSDTVSFRDEAEKELLILKEKFNSVKEDHFFHSISLGERIYSLKEIFNELQLLNDEIDYFNSEVVKGLEVLCDSRIELIDSSIKEVSLEENTTKLSDLKARIEFKASSYASLPLEEKLFQCREIVSSFKELQSALNDYNSYNKILSFKVDECFSFLDKIFDSSLDLSDFLERYNALKHLPSSFTEPSFIQISCFRLMEDVEEFLFNYNPKIKKINEDYIEVIDLIQELNDVSSLNGTSSGYFNEKITQLNEFFSEGKLDLVNSIGVLDEVSATLSGLKNEAKKKLLEELKSFIIKNSYIQLTAGEMLLGEEFSSNLKIHLTNPFNSIEEPLSLRIPVEGEFSSLELTSSSPNVVNSFLEGHELVIELDRMPSGKTFMELDASSSLISFSEETQLLSINQSKAVMSKTLIINSSALIPRIEIDLNLSDSLEVREAFVFFREKKIPFYMQEKNINFFLEDVSDRDEVEIYYSLLDPIEFSFSLDSAEEMDANKLKYSYSLKVKNLLPMELNKVNLLLPLDLQDREIERKEFFDSRGKEVSFSFPSSNSISFSLSSLFPGQEESFSLNLYVNDASAYWNSFIQKIESDLLSLQYSSKESISLESGSILQELNSLKDESNFKEEELLNKISSLREKTDSLIKEERITEAEIAEFLELRNSLLNELESLKNEVHSLNELGFGGYAIELNEKISRVNALLDSSNELLHTDSSEALSLLFQAQSIVTDNNSDSVSNAIEEERTSAITSLEEFFSPLLSSSPEFLSLQEKAFSLDEEISSSLMKQDYSNAKNQLIELKETIAGMDELNNSTLNNDSIKLKEKINLLKEKTNSIIPSLFAELDSIFSSPIPENYVSPITEERLKTLFLQTNSIITASLKEEMELADGNTIYFSSSLEKELEEKLKEAELIEKELATALSRIKEDAFAFLSTAKEKTTSSNNSEALYLLSEAETAFNEKNYFKAIDFSQQAAILSPKEPSPIEIPLAVYPLLVLVAVFVFARRMKFFQKSKEKLRLQKVLRER